MMDERETEIKDIIINMVKEIPDGEKKFLIQLYTMLYVHKEKRGY